MADRKCKRCGLEKSLDQFNRHRDCVGGRTPVCKTCINAVQRRRRTRNGDSATKRYEKTRKGFLMRIYRNMQSRVTGVQKHKHHLYAGKPLLPRSEFYEWAICHPDFERLFVAYEASGYERMMAPSVDRVDSSRGYETANMEWVTHAENSLRGLISRWAA